MTLLGISQKIAFFRSKIISQTMTLDELLDFFRFCEQMSNSSKEFFEEFEDVNLIILITIFRNMEKEVLIVLELYSGKLKFKQIDQEFEKFLLENKENFSKIDIQITTEKLLASFQGATDPWMAMMNGDIKLTGDIQNLLIFEKLFSIFYDFLDL
ncbi:MAG: hypothetical protein DRO88_07605 [Promethearchaeia archaeon]|nr:MAG: hypothetical protein DRO88_07605 [Candidatus Lokiarchaeia archaeon]